MKAAAYLRAGLRPPGAVERTTARRRRRRAEQRTQALGLVGVGLATAITGAELARVWRRGSAEMPAETTDLVGAVATAASETVEVARESIRLTTPAEAALLNMLAAFSTTFGVVRLSTYAIRKRGTFGPFRDLVVGRSHIHHFVPGIGLAFLAGAVSLASPDERLDPWLAVPFGVGAAMTLDESALLLKLDDVYWTEEGIVSLQIAFATLTMLSGAVLTLRVLRRGEREVLEDA